MKDLGVTCYSQPAKPLGKQLKFTVASAIGLTLESGDFHQSRVFRLNDGDVLTITPVNEPVEKDEGLGVARTHK